MRSDRSITQDRLSIFLRPSKWKFSIYATLIFIESLIIGVPPLGRFSDKYIDCSLGLGLFDSGLSCKSQVIEPIAGFFLFLLLLGALPAILSGVSGGFVAYATIIWLIFWLYIVASMMYYLGVGFVWLAKFYYTEIRKSLHKK